MVFAPYPIDAHPDHIAASAIVEAARFYSKFVKTDMGGEPHFPAKLYHYWAVHLRVLEKPSFIVDVGDDLAVEDEGPRVLRIAVRHGRQERGGSCTGSRCRRPRGAR